MKKTMYIPKGQECRYENLTCERIVVDGSLYVDGSIKAKRISGKGFVSGNVILADTVTAHTIDAGKIAADRLIAVRVMAVEIHAVQNMAVSSYIEADYVKAGKVTLADAEICDMQADEVVKLSSKRRGLLGTLFASFVRSKWTALTCRDREEIADCADEDADVPVEADTIKNEAQPVTVTPEIEEAMTLMDDPEFLRLKAMYKLTKETDDIWQLIPKKEPTDRAVTYAHPFDEQEKVAA